jgi:acyl dehydratase
MFSSPQEMSAWIAEHGPFVVESRSAKLSYFQILLHAVADGDFNPAHCIPGFAEHSIFGGIVSHGIGTVSRAEGQFLALVQFARPVETIALGIDNLKYLLPLRRGDVYRYTYEISELREHKSRWNALCHVACKATTFGKPERTVATWDWKPSFIEKPDVSEEVLELLRARSYAQNLVDKLIRQPLEPFVMGVKWGVAMLGGLGICSGVTMLAWSLMSWGMPWCQSVAEWAAQVPPL